MASSSDFYNRLQDADNKLDGVNGRLDSVNTALGSVHTDLGGIENRLDTLHSDLVTIEGKLDTVLIGMNALLHQANVIHVNLVWGFTQLINLGKYTNQALQENAAQNNTMICILEHISQNTCSLLNEAHAQTGLQETIKRSTTVLADLYAATHGDAAIARERLEALRLQVEKCCPPKSPPPPCQYQACPKDFKPLPPLPTVQPPPDDQPRN